MTTRTITMTAETAQTAMDNLKKVSYIGGGSELTISRNQLQALIDSGFIPKKSGTLLYALMEYGMEFLDNGMAMFKEEGDFLKFAIAYDLDPEEAYRHLISFKSCKIPLSTMSVQLTLFLDQE
jgi:hypothetical protein